MVMRQGEIWWADLDEPRGSGPGYRRPVLIIQSDALNQSRIHTAICAIISSNQLLAKAPGNIFLGKKESGLPKDSVINLSQIITLDKQLLDERVESIDKNKLKEVIKGLKLVLDIE
jgi:mRNA interferase MazF